MTPQHDPPVIAGTRTYNGTPSRALTAWLDGTPHHWDRDGDLVVTTPDGPIYPRPGWLLVRWTDDEITVATPRTAHRVYGPDGLITRQHDAIDRVRAAAAQLMRAALDPDGNPLTARDQGIDTAVRRILTALDGGPDNAPEDQP